MTSPENVDGQSIPIDEALIRRLTIYLSAGVAVVTAYDGGQPVGFTCLSLSPVSVEPPCLSFIRPGQWPPWNRVRRTGALGINVLAADQRAVSAAFGRSDSDQFAGVPWRRGSNGAPMLSETLASIEADITFEHEAGDDTLVVVFMTALAVDAGREPLTARGTHGPFSHGRGLEP